MYVQIKNKSDNIDQSEYDFNIIRKITNRFPFVFSFLNNRIIIVE